MAERTSDPLTMDMHELDKLAEFNAQDSYQQYSSPQYGSPAPAMSPYSYPDPAQMPSVYTSTPNTTPSSPHPSLASRTTRSGRRIDSDPLGPQSTGVQKSTAPKAKPRPRPKPKKKKKRDERTAPPTVLEPLTVLLAHLDPKKDADIEAYVNRSIETRLREVGDARGGKGNKIKRPMNAFMLYRKGWQNRIKEMQSNENHQGVSKVAGDGWALEPDEVRNQFNTWSEIERDMHAQAFPDYKFQPKKTDKPENKPSIASDGEDTDLEDNWSGIPTPGKRVYLNSEDPDADYLPPGRVPSRAYGYQQQIPPSRAMSQSPYSQSPYQHHSPPPGVPNMSHYQYSNPHKALPNGYPGAASGHYHAQRIDVQQHQMSQTHPGYSISPQPYQTENVYYHRTEAPSQHHYMAHSPPQHQHLGPPGPSYQHRAAFPGADMYDFQPQLSRSRHPTPASGHRQPAYAMPFDGIADYGVPIPSPTPPAMAGSDGPNNFNAALGEMGDIGELGDFGDHFQIPPSEDPAYELNFPLADGLDALDPQLLEGGAWTAESLPMGALDRPDNFLDPEVQKKTTPVSGHVPPPLPSPLTPTPDSARISTPVSLTATHDAPTSTSVQSQPQL